MKITLYGAAGDVTGSAYYVSTTQADLLIDFGIFQGGKAAELRNRKLPPIDFKRLRAVALTHAHLDHTGRLPLLAKRGFSGPIYATPATIEVVGLILHDSVKVQTLDLQRENRRRQRKGQPLVQPLYAAEDVEKILKLLTPIPYNEPVEILPGISMRAHEAGHILGSVSLELTVTEVGKKKVVVFSGDLGPHDMAIMQDSEPFSAADLVFMESTYGDRDHRSLEETFAEAREAITWSLKNGGKVLIPSFAIGRTQQLLYYIAAGLDTGTFPEIPVYLDSPMAIEATKIYMKHPELFDKEAMELLDKGVIKQDLPRLHTCETAEESMALNSVPGTAIIMAGAGMCNAGRILHHLRHNLWKPETTVLIVGYQGQGSLGRQLVEGAKKVRIFGEEILVKAKIYSLGGLSAHAGQTDLVHWFDAMAASKPRLVLTHGEDRARIPLAALIQQKYGITAELPEFGAVVEVRF